MPVAQSVELASKPGSSEDSSPSLVFRHLDGSTLSDFKLLNQSAFPVKYSDKFYQDCRAAGRWTQLAFERSKLLGAIACRLEAQEDGNTSLYIMSLAVEVARRGQTIGSQLLERMLSVAREEESVSVAYLHVHVSNDDAIRFYTTRGFRKDGIAEHYYRRLKPPHAVILSKQLQ